MIGRSGIIVKVLKRGMEVNNQDNMDQKSNIIIYTTGNGLAKIETTFDEDIVRLSFDQMVELFQRNKSTISKYIKNIFLKES